MKTILPKVLLLIVCVIAWSCGQKSQDQQRARPWHRRCTDEEGNQALYDEVMKIHDEVMPKMNDIYKLKEELKNQIANTPEHGGRKEKGD